MPNVLITELRHPAENRTKQLLNGSTTEPFPISVLRAFRLTYYALCRNPYYDIVEIPTASLSEIVLCPFFSYRREKRGEGMGNYHKLTNSAKVMNNSRKNPIT